jgi:hypothetical protein
MRGYLERIQPERLIGYAYDEQAPGQPVRVTARLDGRVIGTAIADHHREDLVRQGHVRGHCGFLLDIPKLENALAALGQGGLAVEAESEGARAELPHSDIVLTQSVLRSGRLFFGGADLRGFLEQLRALAARAGRAENNARYCLHLLNYARAYFPPEERGADFCALGLELAEAAGAPHTARFYRAQLEGRREEAAPAPFEDSFATAATYATLRDLIAPDDGVPVILEMAQLIDGGRDPSYLGLVELFPLADGPAADGICPLAFRVNGFGGPGWSVTRDAQPARVFEQAYFVDFEQVRRAVDQGRTIIVDMSAEGPPALEEWCGVLNAALADLGIPAAQAMFVSQNLAFGPSARAHKVRANIATGNFNLHKALVHAAATWGADDRLAGHISELMRGRRARANVRKYVCLNFTPRWARWATVLSLSCHGHLGDGYVSFPGISNEKHNPGRPEAYSIPPVRSRQAMLDHMPDFLKLCPLVLDRSNEPAEVLEQVYPTKLFADSLIHIVTETEMGDERIRRVTEKVFKPIVGLQPFLVVGNPGSLDLLRRMGFRTFGGLFDESYDRISNVVQRFDTLEAEMLRCLALDVATLRDAVEFVQDAVVHNFVHMVRVAPTIFGQGVTNRLRALLVRMAAQAERALEVA